MNYAFSKLLSKSFLKLEVDGKGSVLVSGANRGQPIGYPVFEDHDLTLLIAAQVSAVVYGEILR